LILVARVFDAH